MEDEEEEITLAPIRLEQSEIILKLEDDRKIYEIRKKEILKRMYDF
jgi:hypothetical protein